MAKDKDETPKAKSAYEGQDVATISLDRARIVRGTAYGPGENIRVPKAVADALTKEDTQAAKGQKQGRGKQSQ